MASKKEAVKLYEIKIVLIDLVPEIWRRVLVPRDITLENLHYVIQIVMGWEDCHLHDFIIGRKHYGPIDHDSFSYGDPPVNEDIVSLNGVAKPNARFVYHYDFGDNWRHEIRIEREIESESGDRQARCAAGENACPPEDSGGPYQYPDLLAISADPQHAEHDEMQDWLGEDFDPQHFDLAPVNQRLARLKV